MSSSDDPTPPGEQFVASFEPADGDLASDAVLDAVAALVDEEPAALEPLYGTTDPDALDGLVAHAASSDGSHEIWFTYEGFDVGVHSRGTVTLATARDDRPGNADGAND